MLGRGDCGHVADDAVPGAPPTSLNLYSAQIQFTPPRYCDGSKSHSYRPRISGRSLAREVQLRERGQHGHAPNHCADGMVSPHAFCVVVSKLPELGSVALVGPAVAQRTAGAAAGCVHRQGYVAAFDPMLSLFGEGFAAPAMDEDHRGEGAVACGRPADAGEHAGRSAPVRLALVVNRLDQADSAAPISSLHFLNLPGTLHTLYGI
jgi:hypothetical protein